MIEQTTNGRNDVPIIGGYAITRDRALSNEKRLMLAVLEDALNVVTKSTPATEMEVQDARSWFESREDHAFSFEDVCTHLGLVADAVREKLFGGGMRKMRKQRAHQPRFRVSVGTRATKVTSGSLYYRDNCTINARPRRKEYATT
jgi:hypothetical protein